MFTRPQFKEHVRPVLDRTVKIVPVKLHDAFHKSEATGLASKFNLLS